MKARADTRSFFVTLVMGMLVMANPVHAADGQWWRPANTEIVWDIQLLAPPVPQNIPAIDMMVVDLFDTPVATVRALQAKKIRVVCYLNAGAWEDWRLDAPLFPSNLIGAPREKQKGQKWLDIRQPALRPLIESRLDLCRDMGFDAVQVNNVNGFEHPTGFSLTAEEQLAFNIWLAESAHNRGLGIGLNNTTSLATELAPHFDWVTTENCVAQSWCSETQPFLALNKPVFVIEYPMITLLDSKEVCRAPNMQAYNLLFKPLNLGPRSIVCPEPKE